MKPKSIDFSLLLPAQKFTKWAEDKVTKWDYTTISDMSGLQLQDVFKWIEESICRCADEDYKLTERIG